MIDSLYHAASADLFTGMLTRQGLHAAGMAAVDVPRAPRLRGCQSISHVARRNARYPVLLVHGYAASESMWTPLCRALAGAGFGHVVSVTYNSFTADPAAVIGELTDQGLGAASAPLSSRTASAVTIASPHRGAWLARLAPGAFAPLMHRGGGHLTICRDARLICSLVSELISTETSADPARPARADRELMAA
jgi:pimeloyl-ACP methyl ester carboxylesterase